MQNKIFKILTILIFVVLISFLSSYLISDFLLGSFSVIGSSMEPTLYQEDQGIKDIFIYKKVGVKRFDIVIADLYDEHIIKRVIGLPGEEIRYIGNDLYVNGQKVEESFITSDNKNNTCYSNFKVCSEGITLLDDEYFLVGDNRLESFDSRMFIEQVHVRKEDIIGKAIVAFRKQDSIWKRVIWL
ncbi:MAG: signal peptidase I [Bacilli bacterium]|nr:signal peptidase I [Bacilli bacterium]